MSKDTKRNQIIEINVPYDKSTVCKYSDQQAFIINLFVIYAGW